MRTLLNNIIMALNFDDQLSDEEIFFGKLSLKEVKKHVILDRCRHSVTCCNTQMEDNDSSLKIIETCSEPDLKSRVSLNFSDTNSSLSTEHKEVLNWDINSTNDSFLEMEKMVSELQIAPYNNKEELDNTLEVVEYILNNAATHEEECKLDKLVDLNSGISKDKTCDRTDFQIKIIGPQNPPELKVKSVKGPSDMELSIPVKKTDGQSNCNSIPTEITSIANSVGNLKKTDIFSTPTGDIKKKVPVFKTPKTPMSSKKQFITPRKTPMKSNSYQHITSPVATYIKNGPQVPLLKDVRPKKPLTGISSIPKLQKSTESKLNKENVILPSIAYKSAKNMKVIKVPDAEKLPESQWAKKLSSSLLKPVVIKHDHRENNISKKVLEPQSEDSFANLTLHQAEVSVCTQKTAYNTIKKKL